MVQVIPAEVSNIGGALGQALGAYGGNQLGYQLDRNRTLSALQQAKQGAQSAQNPTDLLFSLLEATAGRPGAEKSLSAIFPALLTQMQAKGGQNVNYAGEGGAVSGQGQQQVQQGPRDRQNLPQMGNRIEQPRFLNQGPEQANKFYPNNVGGNEAPGNLPQTATGGEKRPVLGAREVFAEGKRIAAEQTANGIPTTPLQGVEIAKAVNEESKAYNDLIDQELSQRVNSQINYGQKASAALEKIMPGATDEQLAVMKKIGEDAAGLNKSEADIDRIVAKEATKFKNTLTNIEKDLSSPRSYNQLHRKFLGTDKDFKSAAGDLRVKLKPLLDLGLYDTARNLLTKLGYYPEERESVINPLSENQQSQLNLVPKAKKQFQAREGKRIAHLPEYEEVYTPDEKQILNENLRDFLKKNNNASLPLVRKAFEDKNYDWRIFKDSLNELIESGEFVPTDDQFNQLIHLDTPPLNNLQKLLHGINIIGR